ncbi:MAG: hypothetical protein FVQ83_11930 [Chloroflexi bacterium]|nr:hypothetical protein [Chloroflexota bacterium]
MPSPEYDFRYLKAGAAELKSYLLSKELFWPLDLPTPSGEPPYPRLTLGNLALSQARLQARKKGGGLEYHQDAELTYMGNEIVTLRQEWRTAWEKKAGSEFISRLRRWKDYLAEIAEAPSSHAGYFSSQVRLRVILEILTEQLGKKLPAEAGLLPNLDTRLRAVFIAGAFLWDAELTSGFPEGQYWFLYGGLTNPKP